MNNDTYLFDTYAILEVIGGNNNYSDYLDCHVIINEFIFSELCYKLIREKVPHAELYMKKYSQFIVNTKPNIIVEAMRFRVINKKKKLSMTDCISYIMSKDMGISFLTGDKEFEKLENVKFVK